MSDNPIQADRAGRSGFDAGPASIDIVSEGNGDYRGRRVIRLTIPPDMLAVADEDAAIEDADYIEKSLSDRRAERGQPVTDRTSSASEPPSADSGKAAKVEPGEGVSQDAVSDFLSELQSLDQATRQDVLDAARRRFRDASDQYEALDALEDEVEEDGGSDDLLETIKGAKDHLMEEEGPSIRAGLNVVEEAEIFAHAGLADFDELRDFYRKSVLHFDSVAQLFQSVLKRYGKGGFSQALAFLIKAAGNDLNSQGPSMPAAHLRSVIRHLYDVETLGTIHRDLDKLLEKMRNLFHQTREDDDYRLTEQVLALTQKTFVPLKQVQGIPQSLGVNGAEATIYFLTALKNQIRLIPLSAFARPEGRGKVLTTAQEALDLAVEQDR
jgi:type III secretion protein W